MTGGRDLGDFSMLELFRTELETHLATLSEGLLALERLPEDSTQIEALMRAAHSIKGGARLVDIEEIVTLAHVMEDCFVAAQQKRLSFEAQQVDILLRGVDMLSEISDAVLADNQNWLDESRNQFDTLLQDLKHILQPGSAVSSSHEMPERSSGSSVTTGKKDGEASEASLPAHDDTADSRKDSAPSPEANTVDLSLEALSGKTHPPAHSLRKRGGEEPPFSSQEKGVGDEFVLKSTTLSPEAVGTVEGIEPALLDFFRSEVEIHSLVIQRGLESFAETTESSERLDAVLQAIRAIEGGAQIVGIPLAAEFSQTLLRIFEAAQKGLISLDERHFPNIQQGLQELSRLAKTLVADDSEGFTRSSGALQQILVNLDLFPRESSRRSLPPASRKAPPPQTKKTRKPSKPEARRSEGRSSGAPEAQKPQSLQKDRTVRVTATKIERLMGLAGEVVVSARWLPPFSDSLLSLKKTHRELASVLENMRERLRAQDADEKLGELVSLAREKTKEASGYLADRLNHFERFAGTSETLSDRLYHEVIGIRMRPFSDGIHGFPRMVRDLGRELGKKVQLDIVGKSTEVDRDILEKLDAPLTHLMRNAIDHGIEYPEERLSLNKPEIGMLRLEAVHRSGMLLITFSDDGRGIDLGRLRRKIVRKGLANADMVEDLSEAELLKFLFLPGFSTSERVTEISGRGVGLDVVDTMVHEVGGVVRVTSRAGQGMTFYLELPLTLSVIRTFLVEIAGEPYAFPLARIERCVMLSREDVSVIEDRQYFRFDDENISLVSVHEILEIQQNENQDTHTLPVVVIGDHSHSYGILVDRFIGEYDLVVRPLDLRLGKVPDISAVAVMLDGSPILIFDVEDLIRSVDKMLNKHTLAKVRTADDSADETVVKRILVVDDSITVREMERKLLESRGYQVDVAVDGLAGWNTVRSEDFDLVISDVDMPRMNGIDFVSQIKQHEALRALPVMIVSYKDSEEHRLQGLEAGADYYLTKSSFQDDSFITAVVDLIGEA